MDEALLKILLVEDDEGDALLVREYIREGLPAVRLTLDHVPSYKEGLSVLKELDYDLCLLDFRLGAQDGIDLLRAAHASGVTTPIIFLTGTGNAEIAVEAMKSGASDYIVKDKLSPELLRSTIRLATEAYRSEVLRKQAQEALRESEERYRQIVEEASDVVYTANAQGQLTYANPPTERLTGYSDDELIGMHFTDFIMDGSKRHAVVFYGKQFEDRQRETKLELPIVTRDGQEKWIEQTATLVVDNEDVIGFQCIVRDITERKRAEMELAQRVTHLALLNEARAALTQDLDLQSVIRTIVEAVARTFGYELVSLRLLEGDVLILQHQAGYKNIVARIPIDQGVNGQVARTGEPLLVEDVLTFPDFVNAAEGFTSEICVPLFDEGQVVGTFNVGSKGGTVLLQDDLGLMVALGQHLSQAIKNSRLYGDEREQRMLADALHDTTAMLNSTLDLDEVLEAVLAGIGRVLPHTAVDIMLIQDDIGEIVRSRGSLTNDLMASTLGMLFPLARTPNLSQMAESMQPLIISDVRNYAPGWVESSQTAWIRAYVGAPINIAERTIGFVGVYSKEPNTYVPIHAEWLQAFADQTAIAIQNAQLYDATDRRRRYLRTLRSVSMQTTPVRNWQALMQAVADGLVQGFDYQMAMIILGDDEARELRVGALAAQSGLPFDKDYRQSYDLGVIGWVIRHDKPYMTNDAQQDPHYHTVPSFAILHSSLNVPIRHQGKAIGVLSVESLDKQAFNEFDMEAMVELANELGLNLQNLTLNEKAQQLAALEERQRLARDLHDGVSQSLSAALVIAGVLNMIIKSDPEGATKRIDMLTDALKEAAVEMRSLLVELQPAALVEGEISDLLQRLTTSMSRRTETPIDLKVEGTRPLSSDVQIVLYRIAQEALNNAVKHADASQITVRLTCSPEQVKLRVSDDGVGFDPAQRGTSVWATCIIVPGKSALSSTSIASRAAVPS